jgi:hypothetical protein
LGEAHFEKFYWPHEISNESLAQRGQLPFVSPLSLFSALHMSNEMLALSAYFQNGEKSKNMQVPRDEETAVRQSLGWA